MAEHPEILFAKKCLFVEGYDDYRVYKTFLEVYDNYDYTIIPTDGCGSKIWQICDLLQIEYKKIYDNDKINQTKQRLVENLAIINKINTIPQVIKLSIIKEKIKNRFYTKMPYFHSYVFYCTLNNFWEILTDDELKIIKPDKIIGIDTKENIFSNFDIETRNVKSTINMNDFINKYIINYEELLKLFSKEQLNFEHDYNDFISDFFDEELMNYISKNNKDIIIAIFFNKKENNTFICNSKIKDLEGFLKINSNNGNIAHGWCKNKSIDKIKSVIQKGKSQNIVENNILANFLI